MNQKDDSEHKADNFVDYDNLDSDDDEIDNNLICDECDFTSVLKSKLTKHVKSIHKYSCDKCAFITSNKMHLKLHEKSCHKKGSKILKRKLEGTPISSRKKTKKEKKN